MTNSTRPDASVGSPMFVHDFVAVSEPVDTTVLAFTALTDTALAGIVRTSWNTHAPVLSAGAQSHISDVAAESVRVVLSGHHIRRDAAIINVKWFGDGWLPELDADLELVAFGHGCTHLHLMGRYELPPDVERFGPVGSLIQRVTVMAVRGFLVDLSQLLES